MSFTSPSGFVTRWILKSEKKHFVLYHVYIKMKKCLKVHCFNLFYFFCLILFLKDVCSFDLMAVIFICGDDGAECA